MGIKKATRGLPQSAVLGADFDKTTPTACIGPDVFFNDVVNGGTADGAGGADAAAKAAARAVALCDPNGFKPENVAAQVGNAAGGGYQEVPSAAFTYAKNELWYFGVAGGGNAARNGVLIANQKFWDPITAAQASGGAFCCDALYYGADGLGRGIPTNDPPIVAVTKNSAFTPVPLTGEAMEREIVPGGCAQVRPPTTPRWKVFLRRRTWSRRKCLRARPSTHVWRRRSMSFRR